MKLPVNALTETLNSLGVKRRKRSSKAKQRALRSGRLESLEDRRMMDAANLLSDPGFEAAQLNGASYIQFSCPPGTDPSPVPGWTTAQASQTQKIEVQTFGLGLARAKPPGDPNDTQYVELASDAPSIIQQTVQDLQAGATYQLSVYTASREGTSASVNDGVAVNELGVAVLDGASSSALGLTGTSLPVYSPAPTADPSTNWSLVTEDFTATSSSVIVQFSDLGNGGSYGTFIDDASLIQTTPVVSISNVTIAAPTVAGQTATATFTLNIISAGSMASTVNWETANGGLNPGQAGVDYVAASGSSPIPIPADTTGTVSETIPITINAVTAPGLSKTFEVDLSSSASTDSVAAVFVPSGGGRAGVGIGTITNSLAAPVVSISNGMQVAPTVAGQTAKMTFTLDVSQAGSEDSTINWTTAPDPNGPNPAQAGVNYVVNSGSITISKGTTGTLSETISITINAVSMPGPSKTFYVVLSSYASTGSLAATFTSSGSSGSTGTGVGTITNPLVAPSLSITGPADPVQEPAPGQPPATADFTVSTSGQLYSSITVSYTVTSDAGSNYSPTTDTVMFSPSGTAQSQTIQISIYPGEGASTSEITVTLTSVSPGYQATILQPSATATILQYPRVTIGSGPTVNQSTSGNQTASFPVTVTGNIPSGSQVTVTYQTAATANPPAGTEAATAGTDYTAISTGTLTFTSAGTMYVPITVLPVTTTDGVKKVFDLQLVSVTNGILVSSGGSSSNPTSTATLVPPPTVSIGNAGKVLDAAGSVATFPVTLSAPSLQQVTVAYLFTNGTAIAGTDYNDTVTPITFNPGQTTKNISVSIIPTPGHQDDRDFYVTLVAPTGSSGGGYSTTGAVPSSPATGSAVIFDTQQSGVGTSDCGCPTGDSNTGGGSSSASGADANAVGGATISTGAGVTLDQNSGGAVVFAGATMLDSGQNGSPVLTTAMTLSSNQPVPTEISAQLVYPATSTTSQVTGAPVYYSTSGLSPGSIVNFALQADASSLPTGHYDYQVLITSTFSDGSQTTQTGVGSTDLFNRADSPYGHDTWIHDLDQLVPGDGGVAIMRGDGSAEWFSQNSDGTFSAEAGSFNTLTQNSNGTYSLSDSQGDVQTYSSAGLLTAYTLANGQTTTYTYTSAGGVTNALYQVIDPFGHTTTYAYANGVLSTVTDPTGNVTTYAAASGTNLITSITGPNPGDGEQALVTAFTYNTADQLTSISTAGETTTLGYDYSGAVSSIGDPTGGTDTFSDGLEQGLVNTSVAGSSADDPASSNYLTATPTATYTNGNGETTTYQEDQFGDSALQTDAAGNLTQYVRNALGQVTEMIQPNPADLSSPLVTTYAYDAAGNETSVVYPDGTSESWTYDATWNEVTSHTDPDGDITDYTIDPSTGDVLSMTQVNSVAGVADNLVTTYTYTTGADSLPAGLLLSTTDPNGDVTENAYYSDPSSPEFGDLESTTQAYGTALAATTSFTYDANGNELSSTDPLDRVTYFQYDALNRLIKETDPAANPADPSTAPVTSYTYDANGNTLTTTDPDGMVTTDAYNADNQLISQTVSGAAATPVAGLAGQWNFDEAGGSVAVDSSTSGDNGELIGGVTRVAGESGGALQFNGTTGSVSLGDPAALNISGQITISAWVNVASTAGTQDIVARGYDLGPAGEVFLRITSGDFQIGAWNGSTYGATAAIPAADVGQWALITGTYDGADWKLYDDGTLLATSASAIGAVAVDAGWSIGSSTDGDRYFSGEIDGVSIYDRALTQTEIQNMAGGGQISQTTTYTYDADGNQTSMTDPMGRTTSYVYNSLDQQIEVTGPSPDGVAPGPSTTYTYNVLGQLTTTTDPDGDSSEYTYDTLGRMTQEIDGVHSDSPAVTTNLAGSWNFDSITGGATPDGSGNGDAGTVIGGPTQVSSPGGSGLALNGANQYVQMPNAAPLDITGQITVSAWVNVQATDGIRDIVARGYEYDPNGEIYLRINSGSFQFGTWNGVDYNTSVAIPAADIGNWVFLTGVYNGSAWQLYDDGSLISSTASTQGALPAYSGWTIGASASDDRFFGGDIGPVAIYDAALTPGQIAALATAPPQTASAGVTTTYTYDADGNELSMTDPLGRTTEYVYNDLGEQTEVIQPNPSTGIAGQGPTTTTTYDGDGNELSVTDPDGNTVEYVYNALNEQTETIEPNAATGAAGGGPVASATYDLDGEVTSTTDALGNVTTYAYDGEGRETSMTQPAPSTGAAAPVTSYTYDAAGNELSMTDPNGNTTTYGYDGLERQVAIVQPNPSGGSAAGPTTGYIYDADDELVAMIDPLGRVTTYAYNGEGEQTSVSQPAATAGGPATVTSYAYDPDGNVIAETDPNGATTRNVYNSLGEQTETIEPNATGAVGAGAVGAGAVGATTFTTYDADSEVTSTTNELGQTTTYAYDALGRMTSQTAPSPGSGLAATVTSYTYDSDGNLLEQAIGTQSFTAWTNSQNPFDVDGNGSVTPFDALVLTGALNAGHGGALPEPTAGAAPPYYDVLGDGVLSQADVTAIDAYLNDPSAYPITPAQVTTYTYDHLGQETSTTDPDGNVTSFTYDANGNQTSLTDADNNTTTFSYDNLGREIGQSRYTYESASAPDVLVSESVTYDANGNETSATDYDGQTTYYQYNALNEETAELWGSLTSPSATYAYTYDADGELTSAAAPTTSDMLSYDNLGQVTSDSVTGNGYSGPVVITSGYDADGNRTSSSLSIAGTADYVNTYTYDNLDRETSVTQRSQTGGDYVAPKLVDLAYNNDDQVTGISAYADLAATENVYTSAYGYDNAGDLTGLTYTAQGNTLAGYTWTWNPLEEITSFSNTQHTNENLTYSYDPSGQLTGATGVNDPSLDEGYVYDATGNRQSATAGTTTSASQTGVNNTLTTDGTYNYEYDADGNRIEQTDIATGAYTTYAYDFRNELTSVTSYTSAGVVTQTVAYTYDAFERQISETVAVAGGATTTTKFIYDGENIVATLDGTNALTNRYLDGPAVDQVFADEQFIPTEAGELPTTAGIVLYPLVDNLGTDRDLVEYDSSTNVTTVVDHLDYSAFGAVTDETNAVTDYLFGYTGFVRDLATGLDHSQTRDYDPIDGLWDQEDPASFLGQDANLSRYSQNSAVAWTDPTGLATRITATQQQYIDDARQLLKQQRVPGNEIELRVSIIKAIFTGVIKGIGDNRNINYWTEQSKNGPYVVKPGQIPTDAIKNMWDYNQGRVFCLKYSTLIMVRGYIDLAERNRDNGFQNGQAVLDSMNRLFAGKSIPNDLPNRGQGIFFSIPALPKGQSSWQPNQLKPGDQIWFKNRYFRDPLPGEPKTFGSGEEGSNVFYLGNGLVVSIYSKQVKSISDYQKGMMKWDTVKVYPTENPTERAPQPTDFQIMRVRQPLSPKLMYEKIQKRPN